MQETPHHGDRWFKEAADQAKVRETINAIAGQLKERAHTGATDAFPEGALTPDDEGELRFAITAHSGKVIVTFGKPVAWLGLTPRIARQFAKALNEWADKA